MLIGPARQDTDSVTGISLNLPKLDSEDISTNKHNYLHIRIPQPMPLAWNGHLARLPTQRHTTDLMGGPPQNRPARRHTPVGSEPTALNHASANYEQPHKIAKLTTFDTMSKDNTAHLSWRENFRDENGEGTFMR